MGCLFCCEERGKGGRTRSLGYCWWSVGCVCDGSVCGWRRFWEAARIVLFSSRMGRFGREYKRRFGRVFGLGSVVL
ncbi:hypothetical protein M758_12G185200 [Ceratodon purpureus]|nr:hypothetical protein M758_12G185200 [Ceratodon purpureus]